MLQDLNETEAASVLKIFFNCHTKCMLAATTAVCISRKFHCPAWDRTSDPSRTLKQHQVTDGPIKVRCKVEQLFS